MKINEAIKSINATNSARAQEDLGTLHIFMKSASPDDWFLEVDLKEFGWLGVEKGFDTCLDDDISAMDLARVMDVVQQLVGTPVSERFPEKKYRLYMTMPTDPAQNRWYLSEYHSYNIGDKVEEKIKYAMDKEEAQVYTKAEIDEFKTYTSLANVFQKEEVKGDE